MKLADSSIIQVSYAGNSVDISMAKQMMDFTKPVEVEYRTGGDYNQLVSIDQKIDETGSPVSKKSPPLFLWILIPFVVAGVAKLIIHKITRDR